MTLSQIDAVALPAELHLPLLNALREAGDTSDSWLAFPLKGGCTSSAVRLVTASQSYALKWDARQVPGMFTMEAEGLKHLAEAGSVRTPHVFSALDASPEQPGFILMEWMEVQPHEAYWKLGCTLGESLAAMHLASREHAPPDYGLDRDNCIGNQVQRNGWDSDWVRFYRDRRLRPQAEDAAQNGRLTPDRNKKLETLMDRLDEWLGNVERQPVLLHGDLWWCNALFDEEGRLVMIDPAAYWGDREIDLATVELYDPAPDGFFDAYQESWPTPPGRVMRRDLYQLYLILSCLNNGADYLRRLDEILRRYVG